MKPLFILVCVFSAVFLLNLSSYAWDGVSNIEGRCVSGCDIPAPQPTIDPCANGGCEPLPPAGPDPEELRRQAEIQARQQRLRDAHSLNDQGNAAYNRGDWISAVTLYQKAIELNADDHIIRENLRKAQEQSDRAARERASANKINEMISDFQISNKSNSALVDPVQFDFVNPADGNDDQAVVLSNFGLTEQKVEEIVAHDKGHYSSQIQRLMNEIKNIKVPSPKFPLNIQEGYVLGLNDPKSKVAEKYANTISPFNGQRIDTANIFATGDKRGPIGEFLRGLSDNLSVGEHTTLDTETGIELVKSLQGAHFKRLMAHSNGATVAEAFIRSGVIEVEELNVIGGDRSLINKAGLQELIDSGKVKRIVVWYNPYDPIPYGTIVPQALHSLASPYNNQLMKPLLRSLERNILGTERGGDSSVEFRKLQGEKYVRQSQSFDIKNKWAGHDLLNAYLPNIKKHFEQ